jgi:plasmid maintenance system killer protein
MCITLSTNVIRALPTPTPNRFSIAAARDGFRRTFSVRRSASCECSRAKELRDLASPGNRLEKLRGDRERQFSVRINQQWRICFVWRDGDAFEVEIVDYH